MAYLGLARKWRPQVFADLVGQEHIATTLANAIEKNRISQGYLFTGTRGVGKTSAARIFAKALRCQHPKPHAVPCGKCSDCVEISESRCVDVLEIDGASNNGVDAVREIRDNVKFLPSSGKYKIYIIDEVHMLTTAAFNALLKTLEEPPEHIVFIFATTDPQKIPDTVLSRCQRFDFKRVFLNELQKLLKQICESEGIAVDAQGLAILSREAEGSARDAVSLLDQVLSVSDASKKLDSKMICSALGLIDKQIILDCMTGILKGDPLKSLKAIGEVYLHGSDIKQFGRELLRYLRNIMVAKLLDEKKLPLETYLDVSDVDLQDVRSLLADRSLEDLEMLFRLMSHGLEEVAKSSVSKMLMDVLLIKMSTITEYVALDELNSLDQLQSNESENSEPVSIPAATAAVSTPVVHSPPILKAAPKAVPLKEVDLPRWKLAVEYVKAHKPLFGSALENLGFDSARIDGVCLVITLLSTKETAFYREQLDRSQNLQILAQTLQTHFGCDVRILFQERVEKNSSLVKMEEDEKNRSLEGKRQAIMKSEAMQGAQQLLGAKLEKLELKGE